MVVTTTVPEREYGENFPVALRILPRDIREHLHTIYQIARMIDDTGDQLPGDRTAQLMEIRRELSTVWNGAPTTAPMVRLAETVDQCRLPEEPFQELVEANLQDQRTSHYPTFEDLLAYCRLSAVPVGRMVLGVFGQKSVELEQLSDDVCVALQLLEHWQDVGEDCRNGRIYLPQEDMERFGVTADHIRQQRCDAAWRALMAFEVERARAMLASGAPLALRLPGRVGWELRLVVQGGLRILERIETSGYDVFRRRPQLHAGDWLRMLGRALCMTKGAA